MCTDHFAGDTRQGAELSCAMRLSTEHGWRPCLTAVTLLPRDEARLRCAAPCLQITAAATAALAPRIAQLMNSRLAAATATVNVYFHLIKMDDGAA